MNNTSINNADNTNHIDLTSSSSPQSEQSEIVIKLNQTITQYTTTFNLLKSSKCKLKEMLEDIIKKTNEYKSQIALQSQKSFTRIQQNVSSTQDDTYLNWLKGIHSKLISLKDRMPLPVVKNNFSSTACNTIAKKEENYFETNLPQEKITEYLTILMDSLDMNQIEEYYMNNFWRLLHQKYFYKMTIEPSSESGNVKKDMVWKINEEGLSKKLIYAKYFEISIIKKRKNSLIIQLIHYIRNNFFQQWIMRMDENNNIMIKGILKEKENFYTFENYFMTPCPDYKNIAYVHWRIYFTAADLLCDYSSEYDKSSFKGAKMTKLSEGYEVLTKIRKSNLEMKNNANSNTITNKNSTIK